MTIKEFILSDETLSNLHFMTAYQTILTLIAKDMLSIDDFVKLETPTLQDLNCKIK